MSNQEKAVFAFIQNVNDVQNILTGLKLYFTDHMELSPDNINWSHVGSVNHVKTLLNEINEFLGVKNSRFDMENTS